MAYIIPDADAYINGNCVDVEDWQASDEARKTRLLNVAGRELTVAYPKYTIPNSAVYEFANVLAIMFNDTLRMQQQGIASFALTGAFNVTFKDHTTSQPYESLRKFIPQSALDLIGAENGGIKISKRSAKWTVM
ncbi:hypothetical protein M3231_15150 [Neobacillus mesonae]|nr:hypothetical protein [Neobacillus mesonae]